MLHTNTLITQPSSDETLDKVLKQKCQDLENWFSLNYTSCGTNVLNKLHNLSISVTKKADKKANKENWHWANDRFITALFYCNSTTHQAIRSYGAYQKCKNATGLPKNGLWLEAYTPLIMIYTKEDLLNLLKQNLAEYYRYGYQSTTHTFDDPKEYLGEWAIHPSHEPVPKLILIGRAAGPRPLKEREQFKSNSLIKLEQKYPTTLIYHLPDIGFKAAKKITETGSSKKSMIQLKILQFLKKVI